MLIFADHKKEFYLNEFLGDIQKILLKSMNSSLKDHSVNTELLIKFGEFESSLVDMLCGNEDFIDPVIENLRNAAILTGHIFINSMVPDKAGSAHYYVHKLQNILQEISGSDLSKSITVSIPEGYAYYGLYPEMYFEAAHKFLNARRPEDIFAIGIRSIGTSLSAVVSACLEENSCRVSSFTLRPRGDYFNRQIKLSNELDSLLNFNGRAFYLIIDEGPGLSGTSLCSVAEYLSCLGIPEEKIIFFPSWEPDAKSFVSELSRKRWYKHEKYTVNFEEAIVDTGRLKALFQCNNIYDISAGKWRGLFFKEEEYSPAVYQNFEQRKYICSEKPLDKNSGIDKELMSNPPSGWEGKVHFVKFAGLGHYGRILFERAQKLFEAGFSPKPYRFENGFITYDFVQGKPLRKEDASLEMLDRFAAYLSFLKGSFPSKPEISLEELKEMIKINITKGIGEEWSDKFDLKNNYSLKSFKEHSVEIDGRMLPHEWLKTEKGLIKTDSIHHHSDHLLPGPIDIAWDVAGTIVEFGLDTHARRYFLDKYASFSNDNLLNERLDFYLIAYLAFRLGYAKFAGERLPESSDGLKFQKLSQYYSFLLKNMLLQGHSD